MPGHEQWAHQEPIAQPAPVASAETPQSLPVAQVEPSQPTPFVLEGSVVAGGDAPGQWIELSGSGNVVFQLTSDGGPAPEVLFADAGGTWFQVPPMDPASGAVALPLEAGRYYVQLRDPAQRGAPYRLLVWPPARVAAAPAWPTGGVEQQHAA
jgi:hypothetical protein